MTTKRYGAIKSDFQRDPVVIAAQNFFREFSNETETFQFFTEFYMLLMHGTEFLACDLPQFRYLACEFRLLSTGFFDSEKILKSEFALEFLKNNSNYLLPAFNSSRDIHTICKNLLIDDNGIEQNRTENCEMQNFQLQNFISDVDFCLTEKILPNFHQIEEILSNATSNYLLQFSNLKSHLDQYKSKFAWDSEFFG